MAAEEGPPELSVQEAASCSVSPSLSSALPLRDVTVSGFTPSSGLYTPTPLRTQLPRDGLQGWFLCFANSCRDGFVLQAWLPRWGLGSRRSSPMLSPRFGRDFAACLSSHQSCYLGPEGGAAAAPAGGSSASPRPVSVQLPAVQALGSGAWSLQKLPSSRQMDTRLRTSCAAFTVNLVGRRVSRRALLRQEEPGPEALDALRRLFLIVSATKYNRKRGVPGHGGGGGVRKRQPQSDDAGRVDGPLPRCRWALTPTWFDWQGDRKQVGNVGQRVFKVLESRQPEGPSLRPLLPVVSKVASLAPGTFHEDQANLLNKRLVDWLRYVSVPQGLPHSSGGFFTPRARQPGPVTEVDGAVATDFFTVLSTAQRFTEDQWLNGPASGTRVPPVGPLDAGAEASRLSLSPGALRRADSDLQKACLVEAVLVLDVLCRQDPSFLYRTLSCLKALQARLCGTDPACVRALLPLAQFFLSHGEAAAMDSEAMCQHVFSRVPAEHFHSPMLAFELVQFCRDSLPLLGRNLSTLRRSFPSLLKARAGGAGAQCQCLTGEWLSPAASERPLWDASLRTTSCPDTSQDPQLQGLLQHLLCPRLLPRGRAVLLGAGTAFMSRLTRSLSPGHPSPPGQNREQQQVFARGAESASRSRSQFADGALTNQLARLLLERSDSLYQVPGYAARVHQYLAVSWDRRCTVDQINKFFEALEALLFEVTQSRPSATLPQCPPQLVTALMTTLTKLASRSQDLIPRYREAGWVGRGTGRSPGRKESGLGGVPSQGPGTDEQGPAPWSFGHTPSLHPTSCLRELSISLQGGSPG
ncbi:PREDICTED: LOW QUALITY PROTEIN: AP-5 complex subunit zeta-1 [Myotis brandtii]|uniref:LOW QUALITY PROTEIN: AP-5 complex subunit zeta-1 n=1 Tax=Myotis brandtii TaxID=109478 RepID=UPI0007040B9A|nr:PREDICTED: LOW QUALITY PROTEIN: AP-5 complex subunit zeta-1 [Myotis brandtii]